MEHVHPHFPPHRDGRRGDFCAVHRDDRLVVSRRPILVDILRTAIRIAACQLKIKTISTLHCIISEILTIRSTAILKHNQND